MPTNLDPRGGQPQSEEIDRDSLWSLFKSVERDGSGKLSERELRNAIVGADIVPFSDRATRMMVYMFDDDVDGLIDFEDFCRLYSFVT